jgi:tetratricopeptide (TPR) repeat protein
MDFEDYPRLSFREKRQRLFDYAHAAEADAIPTLRAIVKDDQLEPSFFVKLAAAKALAGLRDMWGYNFLIVTHPDLTLKKPEVSRELLIIQGYEHIRDKNYQRAVEDLQKILDEYPFDFRANYHIAFAYLLLKNYAKAIHHFEIARRVNPQDQLTLYNLACAYALAGGKSAEALEALEASVKAGFDDHEHIERDPDLDSLREDQRYRQLIERMKDQGKL